MRRTLGYLGFLLLLASALMLGASQLLPRLDAANWLNATETTGQIVGFSESGSSTRPLVCFVASNGDPYIFEADLFYSTMRQGQIVSVRYFFTPELQASLKADFSTVQILLGIAGSLLTAAGLASLLLQMRKSSLRRQLMLYGARLDATVTGIDGIDPMKANGRHPFTITCTMRNPQGIGELTVKSGWVWKFPPFLQIGGTIPVLVDVNRPGKYCILVEEASVSSTPSEDTP